MKLKRLLIVFMTSLVIFTSFMFIGIIAADSGIVEVGSGEEKLYAIFDPVSNATSYNAYYKESNDSNYTKIDSELVRNVNSKIRIDAVGLSAGNYYLKFAPIIGGAEDASKTIELKDIVVSAYDRSGYAHFGTSEGIGAYNNDGTLKSGTIKVYLTEENKNTVTAEINNTTYTGISAILKAQRYSDVPLDIRIIGTVGAAIWNQIEYDPTGTYRKNKNLPTENVIGANGKQLPASNLDESDIISGGYNTLDTSVYSKLNGLTNKIKLDSDNTFDSYYNMLDVDYPSNVTVEGIGADATIDQWGFTWKRSSSIEVRNLNFDDYPEDACALQGDELNATTSTTSYDISNIENKNIWIHHNTFNEGYNPWDVCTEQDKHEGDGATDVKFQRNVTYSYNHFYKNHKTGLVGGSDKNITANVTYHHNWYQENQSRMPFARQANMHMYNNYYDSSTGTTMQIYAGAYAFIENCYFKNDNKTFELNNKGYKDPAIKSYNNIFDGSKTTSPATIVSSRDASVSNGNIFNSSFDTDSSFFYYDSTNKVSKVTVMNEASELPTLLPTITGHGIYLDDSYTIVSGDTPVDPVEPEEDLPVTYDNTSKLVSYEDFSTAIEATKTSGTPTTAGLFYKLSSDGDANEYNYVRAENGSVTVYDNSSKTESSTDDGNSVTTNAYYMFESKDLYNSGVVTYSIDLILNSSNSKWKMLSFIDNNGMPLSIYSDENKYLGYYYDTASPMFSTAYSTGTHNIKLIVDYDNDVTKIVIDGTEATVNYNPTTIKGFAFTTSAGSARTYKFDNVRVEKEVDNLLLGYQKGKYTSNNTSYNALRIIGKFDYTGIISNTSEIDNIKINIDFVNLDNEAYNNISANIDNVYSSLELTNGKVVAPQENNTKYYYTVIRGITSSKNGYKIKATTVITLTNGQTIECSGFIYEIS